MSTKALLGYRSREIEANEGAEVAVELGFLREYDVSDEGRHVTITLTGGGSWGMPRHEGMPTPRPGADVRYMSGWGSRVRLVVINGYVHHYVTLDELREENDRFVARHMERKLAELDANREAQAAREAALIPELAGRCEALRSRSSEGPEGWDAEYWPYDLYVCEEAQKVILAARDGSLDMEALQAGEVSEYPGMSDQHSGNTFGASVFLAALVLDAEDAEQAAIRACTMKGAMARLVGSERAG